MARVTAAEAARTRERLLDAALEVFWEEGLARPSLTKVAARAGMTRGAIYGHFANKSALFSDLCDRYLLPAAVLAEIREARADDPLGALVDWVTSVLHKAHHDRAFRMLVEILFLGCEAVEGDAIHERLVTDATRARHHEQELLQQAVALGQLPEDLDVPLAAITLHAMVGGHLRFFALNREVDATPVIARIGAVVLDLLRGDALRTPRGR